MGAHTRDAYVPSIFGLRTVWPAMLSVATAGTELPRRAHGQVWLQQSTDFIRDLIQCDHYGQLARVCRHIQDSL